MSKLRLFTELMNNGSDDFSYLTNKILGSTDSKYEFDTSVLNSIFESTNDTYVKNETNVIDYVKNNKSDYVVLSDFSESTFKISDVVLGSSPFYHEVRYKTKPIWDWRDNPSRKDRPTDSDIARLEPEEFNELPIRYEYISYFNIVESKVTKLPEQCMIELGISYTKKDDKTTYNTMEVMYLDLGESRTSKYLDKGTGLMEVKTLHGLDVMVPIKWENPINRNQDELHWENRDKTEFLPIQWGFFGKSTETRSFLIVFNENTIFLYLTDDSIENYWISYCNVYFLNQINHG